MEFDNPTILSRKFSCTGRLLRRLICSDLIEATKSPLVCKFGCVGCFVITGALNSGPDSERGVVLVCLSGEARKEDATGVNGFSSGKLKDGVVAEAHFLGSSSSYS